MLRVVLGGKELDGFEIEAPASSVRLLLPRPGESVIEMPTWTGNQFESSDGRRAPIRTFTPRRFDAAARELTIDVVLHGGGAANDWVRTASVGDEVAISGPGRAEPIDESAAAFLLVGDETALPAIGQLLEWIEPDRRVEAHVEVRDPSARIELPHHPNATVTWHVAADGAAPGDEMVAVVTSADELPDAVWAAGEAAAIQRIRKHLFEQREMPRSRVTARGYWKLGRSAT